MTSEPFPTRYVTSVSIDWDAVDEDSYVRGIPSIASLETLELTSGVTFFVGENGTGKSTLLEAIAVAWGFNPEGGSRHYSFSTYSDTSDLAQALHLTRSLVRQRSGYFFRAESFFNVETQAVEYDSDYTNDGRTPHEHSHGESFLGFFQAFDRPGLYIMDEPEAALSPQRQLTLLAHVVAMARAGSQFLIVSHSPILLATPGARILSFDDGRVHEVGYEQTESYQIAELIVNNRESLLRRLLEEDEG